MSKDALPTPNSLATPPAENRPRATASTAINGPQWPSPASALAAAPHNQKGRVGLRLGYRRARPGFHQDRSSTDQSAGQASRRLGAGGRMGRAGIDLTRL